MYAVKINDKEYKIEFTDDALTQGKANGEAFDLDLAEIGRNFFHLIKDHNSYAIEVVEADYEAKKFQVKVNGEKFLVQAQDETDLLLRKMGMSQLAGKKTNALKAPMPGMVLDVLVEQGQAVKQGDSLLILEAMKMENNLKATADATVKAVKCQKGQAVEKNAILLVFE